MSETPRDDDREFRRPLPGPLQERVGFDHERGRVTRFVVQLEYHHDGVWRPVVRYDHDGTGMSTHAHDITEEGLHMDIYRDGEKHATEYIAPPVEASIGLDRAEDHLANNLQRFTKRYERWHEIRDR
ncbi:MAG: DUF7718 family protein [Halorhabdus sp.]